MKRIITNQPGKQNIRKLAKKGTKIYKPYGKGSTAPGGIVVPPIPPS
jgi:hypothetical protein